MNDLTKAHLFLKKKKQKDFNLLRRLQLGTSGQVLKLCKIAQWLVSLLLTYAGLAEARPQPDAAGWVSLFDGHSLAGWKSPVSAQPPQDWSVRDGAIVLHHQGAYFDLITAEDYGKFELKLEWKVSKDGNSGVIYDVNPNISNRSWKPGLEYQILDNAHGEPPVEQAASIFDLYAPTEDATKTPGEGNEARIVVNGPLVEHWLNGRKVASCDRASADFKRRVAASKFAASPRFGQLPSGRIALQDHGDDVAFRNIMLRRLSPRAEIHAPETVSWPASACQGIDVLNARVDEPEVRRVPIGLGQSRRGAVR